MEQSFAAAIDAEYCIPTGFGVIRVVGDKPKFKNLPDMREVVLYTCYLSECYGINGKEPCEYLSEKARYLLDTAKYMVNTGLDNSEHLKPIVNEEQTEIKYLI